MRVNNLCEGEEIPKVGTVEYIAVMTNKQKVQGGSQN